MNDDMLRDLLRETADEVAPGDRLDAIRAATAGGRRTAWGWWAVGGAGLVAASVVTALALTTGGTPRGIEPEPAAPAPTTNATTGATGVTEPDPDDPQTRVVPVYFVGDTPDGPRLYRELRSGDGPESAETFALDAALHGDSLDPDYRSLWPDDASAGGYAMHEELITVSLTGDLHDRPAGMSEQEARLAIEQVVRTAQGVFGNGRVPVRLVLDNERTDQVLGVPTSEPLTTSPDLEVLAMVSLDGPVEGQVVDNDGGLMVTGLGNSFEGNIVIQVRRWEGTEVVVEAPTIAGTYEDHLFPFAERLSLFDVPAGDYLVLARTDDPSGRGRFHIDTRRITVVD